MFKHMPKLAIILTSLLSQLPSQSMAEEFDNLLLFGDSLFDTGAGNALATQLGVTLPSPTPTSVPLAGPYLDNRHSNGPIWIDFTSNKIGIPFTNFAVTGADTGSGNDDNPVLGGLKQQIQRFSATSSSISPHTIVIMDGGANDLFELIPGALNPPDPAAFQAAVKQAITNLAARITELQDLGAERIILWNLPDLGMVPLFTNAASPLKPAAPLFTGASIGFDTALPGVISQFNMFKGSQQVFILDVFSMFKDLEVILQAQGIDLTKFAWIASYGGPFIQINDPADVAYFDAVHPTTDTWKLFSFLVSSYIENLIQAPRFMASQVNLAFETGKAHRDVVENHFRTLNMQRYIYNNRCCNTSCDPCETDDNAYCDTSCDPCSPNNYFQVYADGAGKWGSVRSKSGSMGFNYNTGLGLIGVDLTCNPNTTFGASFTVQQSNAKLNNCRGSMDLTDYISTFYAAYFAPCYFVDAAFSYHYGEFKNIKRQIPFMRRTAKAKTNLKIGEWNVEAGYISQYYEGFTMIPIIGFDFQMLAVGKYREHNAGAFSMSIHRQHQRSFISIAGLQFFWEGFLDKCNECFDNCLGDCFGARVLPFAEIYYEHEFLRNLRRMSTRLENSTEGAKNFSHINPPERDVIRYSVGADVRWGCIEGNISYVGETDFKLYSNAVRGQLDFAF